MRAGKKPIWRNRASFVAVPSGDYETFCWDVTRDEYVRLMGHPPRKMERSPFCAGLFQINPGVEVPDTHVPGAMGICKIRVWRKWNKDKTKFTAHIQATATGGYPKQKRR
jgi:hypothetical protein